MSVFFIARMTLPRLPPERKLPGAAVYNATGRLEERGQKRFNIPMVAVLVVVPLVFGCFLVR